MTIQEKQNELISTFSGFNSWEEKYEYIIELCDNFDKFPTQYKNEKTLIKGCHSKVWLHAEIIENKVVYYSDSEAVIIKGLIALMTSVASGHTPEEIAETDFYFIEKAGLKAHFFSNRSTGLSAMVDKIKSYARIIQVERNN
jgi:cysteine desulfuration protein SufE